MSLSEEAGDVIFKRQELGLVRSTRRRSLAFKPGSDPRYKTYSMLTDEKLEQKGDVSLRP